MSTPIDLQLSFDQRYSMSAGWSDTEEAEWVCEIKLGDTGPWHKFCGAS